MCHRYPRKTKKMTNNNKVYLHSSELISETAYKHHTPTIPDDELKHRQDLNTQRRLTKG